MKKSRILGLTIAAALALAPVSASAHGYHHFKHFKHFKHFHHYKPAKVSGPTGPRTGVGKSTPAWASYMGISIGCSTLLLMLESANKQLSRREAHNIVLSCFLTPVGANALMQLAYKKMPGER